MDGSTPVDTGLQNDAPPAKQGKKAPKKKVKAQKAQNAKSTIGFPYLDLESAIGVARAILDAGGIPLSRDQLAAAMNLAAGSGNFVIRTSAARQFGLVESSTGRFQLTALGFDILSKEEPRVKAAKAEAFLNVDLYRKVYEEFRGKPLPPRPLGLEALFVRLGVAEKQRDKARHAFDKSAMQAGYFPNGNNERLVEPILGPVSASSNVPDQRPPSDSVMRVTPAKPQPPVPELHPFIEGLLQTLPAPNTVWALKDRTKWLNTAAGIFDLIYRTPENEAPRNEQEDINLRRELDQ